MLIIYNLPIVKAITEVGSPPQQKAAARWEAGLELEPSAPLVHSDLDTPPPPSGPLIGVPCSPFSVKSS
jgi:hypothetical protein